MIIDKEKTVCMSGHRGIDSDLNVEELYQKLYDLAIKYDTFLVGMAVGFDTICAKCLIKIRDSFLERKIRIIACIPCENQADRFSFFQKREYKKILQLVDEKIVLNKTYTSTCMMERNRFMVDNSSYLLAYLRRNYGGTYNTVSYAKKKGITVEII